MSYRGSFLARSYSDTRNYYYYFGLVNQHCHQFLNLKDPRYIIMDKAKKSCSEN